MNPRHKKEIPISNVRTFLPWAAGCVAAVWIAAASQGAVIITTDPAVAAAFMAGGTVENFDDLTAFPITSYAAGQTIPADAKFSSRDGALFPTFHSGGASPNDPVGNPGTPVGIFAPGGDIAGDVVSAANVVGPLTLANPDEPFNFGFMEVIFPQAVARVGFWLTSGNITLFLRDGTGSNLPGDSSATVEEGQFVGIARDTADVVVAAMGFPEHFTLDDFTYSTTPIPETGTLLNLGAVGAVLLLRRRWCLRRQVV